MKAPAITPPTERAAASRLRLRLIPALVLALGALAVGPAPAAAAPQWLDGVGAYQYFPNCGGSTGWVQSYVSYWGETDGSYPLTGQRYWGKITVGIVGNPCAGGEWTATDVILPAHTSFDLTGGPGGNVRCYYTSGLSGSTSEVTNDPNAHCTQNPGAGFSGHGRSLGARTTPSYGIFEIIFPLKTTERLQGSASNDRIVAPVTAAIASPGFAAPQQYVWVGQAAVAPTNTTAPTVAGTPQVGQSLTAQQGSWSGTTPIAYAYQWRRCDSGGGSCSAVAGATAKTYALGPADQGHRMRVVITASNSAGSGQATSAPTAAVSGAGPLAPASTSAPTISGIARAGQLLRASTGSWAGTPPLSYAYQWLRCEAGGDPCSEIPRATGSTFTPGAAEVGRRLRIRVRATNGAGAANATSNPTATVAPAAPGGGDTTPPVAEVFRGPPPETTRRKAKLKFRADEPASFRCKLDRRKYRRCSSPVVLKRLSPGRHVFRVRATDSAGNEGKPASWTWKVKRTSRR